MDTNYVLFYEAQASRRHLFAQFRTGMELSALTKVRRHLSRGQAAQFAANAITLTASQRAHAYPKR